MNATSILSYLQMDLKWMVLFKLSTIRRWADDLQMKAMFHLPGQVDLQPVSHVVLSSEGRFLAPLQQPALLLLNGGECQEVSRLESSLLDRHRALFEAFQVDEADCLGFASTAAAPPVLLHLVVKDGDGHAQAVFHREPSGRHYELLKAVGVEYLGGCWRDAGFVASFRNRLAAHLHAGSCAAYSRTANCNRFFFNHGEIDCDVESGLQQAAADRIGWAREKGLDAARQLAAEACENELAMTCQPPPPQDCFAYGDLVPLGFLLSALKRNARDDLENACAALREKLMAARQGALWAFHSKRLVTATDSVLVLHGLLDREGIEALEQFSDGHGAYYPQLWSQTPEPGRMVIGDANAHWCQSDFTTTCLVRGLRAQADLATVTPLAYLERNFSTRSGLFFANPYFTDWALAYALAADVNAGDLKRRLREEILASTNADFTFGSYDVALSTSFAILALAALGCRGRLLRMAQLSLLEMMDPMRGTWPACTPFYSTKRMSEQSRNGDHKARGGASAFAQVISVNGTLHKLSLYVDTHCMISTAAAVMALSEPCDARERDILLENVAEKHPRYRCTSHASHVAEFALSSYVAKRETRTSVERP